jgi:hypothetical protein
MKNPESGIKDVYIRIIDPRGEVLNVANKIQEITIDTDSIVQYTTNYNFNYANKKISDCQLWTRGNVLIPGDYYFEFIMDGEIIGISKTKFR